MNNLTQQMENDQTDIVDRTSNVNSLSTQVKKLESAQRNLETQEENLRLIKQEIERLSGEVIPTMMTEMGLSSLKLADGSSVDVKPYYRAAILIKNKEAAYNWLRQNGLGDIIKNEKI